MRMIEVLVSDLGQVVLPYDFAPARAFLSERCRCTGDDGAPVEPWRRLVELHDRAGFGVGRCSAEDFFAQARTELNMDATFEEFCDVWSDVFEEDARVIALIRRAPVKHRFLLSNTNSIHWDWITRRHAEALAVFDRLLPSQEIGLEKPAPEVYRYVETLTGRPPSAHLMIDDIAANVEAARACGWDGIVHTTAGALETALRARGLAWDGRP